MPPGILHKIPGRVIHDPYIRPPILADIIFEIEILTSSARKGKEEEYGEFQSELLQRSPDAGFYLHLSVAAIYTNLCGRHRKFYCTLAKTYNQRHWLMETALPYRQYRPAVVLGDYVECYWAWRTKRPSIGAERLIPGGRIELAFNFGDEMDWVDGQCLFDGNALPGCSCHGPKGSDLLLHRLIATLLSSALAVFFRLGGREKFSRLLLTSDRFIFSELPVHSKI